MTTSLASGGLAAGSNLTAWAGFALVAQTADTPTTIIGAFIAVSLSMAGLIGLVVKKLLDDAKEERKDAQADRAKFTAVLAENEARYDKRSAEETQRVGTLVAASDARFEKLRQFFQDELEKQRQLYDRKMGELQAMYVQALQSMRTAVHDVKDTAQTAIVQAAVRDATRGPGDSHHGEKRA